jgi:hypothetical protein
MIGFFCVATRAAKPETDLSHCLGGKIIRKMSVFDCQGGFWVSQPVFLICAAAKR